MVPTPTAEEINVQVDILCRSALSQKALQADLLRYLIDLPVNDPRTGTQILYDFYKRYYPNADKDDTEKMGKQLVGSLRDSLNKYYRELPPEAPDRVVIEVPSGRGTQYRPQCSYRNAAPDDNYQHDVLATFTEWPMEIGQRIKECRRKLVVCITGWSNLDVYVPSIDKLLRTGRAVEFALWDPNSQFARLRSSLMVENPDQTNEANPDFILDIIAGNLKALEKLRNTHPQLTVFLCAGWGSVSLFWIDDLIYFSMYWVRAYTVHGPHFLVSANSTTGKRLQQEYRAMIGADGEVEA